MIKRTFIINGTPRTVLVDENETLASFLRERMHKDVHLDNSIKRK